MDAAGEEPWPGCNRKSPRGCCQQTNRVPQRTVYLLGRDVPVAEQKGSFHALDHDKPASPRPAHAYVSRALGEHLPAVRQSMKTLAGSLPPEELNRIGFRLYEHFRPEVPPGVGGWARRASST